MSFTPADIRNVSFPTQMRGYDKDAVDRFVEQCAQSVDQARQEAGRLQVELDSVRSQLSSLRQYEETIKSTAIDARRNADQTIKTAKEEAQKILANAEKELEQTTAGKTERVKQLESQLTKLELVKRSYLTKLKAMINSHFELISEISGPDFDTPSTAKTPTASNVTPTPKTPAPSSVAPTPKPKPAPAKPAKPNGDSFVITGSTEVTRDNMESIASVPQPTKSSKVEEANAPEPMVASALTAAEASRKVMDPELAAALERYQNMSQAKAKLDEVMSGDELPRGFVPRLNTSGKFDESTDKLSVGAKKAAAQSMEPNAINLDVPTDNAVPPPPPTQSAPTPRPVRQDGTGAINLARELDEVAQRFEEEMDKADRDDEQQESSER